MVLLLQYSSYVREHLNLMLLQPLPPFNLISSLYPCSTNPSLLMMKEWHFCVVLQWVLMTNPPKITHSFPVSLQFLPFPSPIGPFLTLFPNWHNPNHFLQICSSKQFTKPPSPVGLIWGLWKLGLKSVRRISGGVSLTQEVLWVMVHLVQVMQVWAIIKCNGILLCHGLVW